MKLTDEQRSAIRAALNLLGIPNKEAADDIGIARSAFSDALRKDGKRAFPDAMLEILLGQLDDKLAIVDPEASLSERSYRALIREQLQSISNQAKTAAPGALAFAWIPVGNAVPQESRQLIEIPAIRSAPTAVQHFDRLHCFAGPKMGKTTLAEIYAASARAMGYPVVYVRTDRSTPRAAALAECLANLFAAVTGDAETARDIAGCPSIEVTGVFRQKFTLWFKDFLVGTDSNAGGGSLRRPDVEGRGAQPARGVVILESLDDFIGESFSLELFTAIGMALKELSNQLRASISLITFSAPFAAPDVVDVRISTAFMSSGYHLLAPIQSTHIVEYLNKIGLDPRNIDVQGLADVCGGNWFCFQILGDMLRRNWTEKRAADMLIGLYENAAAVAGEDAELIRLARHVQHHKQAAQRAITDFATTYDEMRPRDSAHTILVEILARSCDPYNPLVGFMRRLGLVNQEGRIAEYAKPIVSETFAALREAPNG